jgi:nucleoside-diphosphate-sugar epimerase
LVSEILVSGYTGFIGEYLCEALQNSDINLVRIDLRNPDLVESLSRVKSEVYLHLGESAYPDQEVNSASDENTSLLLTGKFGRPIYFSSSLVYGTHGSVPFTQSTKTVSSSSYVKRKLLRENLVLENLGVVLRVSNVYGRRNRNKGVVGKLIRSGMQKDFFDAGFNNAIRDFIHLSDLTKLVLEIVKAEIPSGVFHAGTGVGTSVRQICEIVQEFGVPLRIRGRFVEESDSDYNVLSIKENRFPFHWEPFMDIKQGVERLIEEFIESK